MCNDGGFSCCVGRCVCVCVCVCVLKLQVNRFPSTLPDTAVEIRKKGKKKKERAEWAILPTTPRLCPLGLKGGWWRRWRCRGGYKLQVPRLSGGRWGSSGSVWMSWIIVDEGIPHFVGGVIRHRLNHRGRLAFHSALPGGRLKSGWLGGSGICTWSL